MLALPHRRQDFPLHQTNGAFTSSQLPTFNNNDISAQLYDEKLLYDYLDSQRPTTSALEPQLPAQQAQFMTEAYDFENPAIRIQQSTPTPHLPSTFAHSSMNATGAGFQNWNSLGNNAQGNSQSLQTPKTSSSHRRAASSSSIGSDGSQYQAAGPGTAYSYVAHSENSPSSTFEVDSSLPSADEQSRSYSHHLPTPSHTPTQDSFMNNSYNSYPSHTSSGMQPAMTAHYSMKEALMDQNLHDDEVPGMGHSARQSVSSYGNSPATPHMGPGEDVDDKFKMPPNGETLLCKVDSWLFDEFLTYDDDADMRQQAAMQSMDRSFQDGSLENVYDNSQMFHPLQTTAPPKQAPPNPQLLSPFRSSNPNTIVQRTLQAAQIARSQSPSSSVSRGASPFRHNSPFRQPSTGFNSPHTRVATAAEAREQKIQAEAAHAMKQTLSSEEEDQPKTISPKDALLDYHETDDDAKMPLFSESGASEYASQYNGSGDQYSNATQSTFDTTTTTAGQPYRKDSWATPSFSPNFTSAPSASQPAPFSFVPPAIAGNLHGLPYSATSQYRSIPTSMQPPPDPTPDFPAHLTSMESSASEAEPQNSQNSNNKPLQKPASSAADTGTYTCTYHGCTQRFETPQKLQKHKREGHRNTNPTAVGSSMTSAALLERNSQAGPHKCERINPTTGKPCNTIFSRPYDLTRHEDTIHNARKQKVRCALCTEEKTFSRNDALTRHMVRIHHRRPRL
jgi:hypothetical protein